MGRVPAARTNITEHYLEKNHDEGRPEALRLETGRDD